MTIKIKEILYYVYLMEMRENDITYYKIGFTQHLTERVNSNKKALCSTGKLIYSRGFTCSINGHILESLLLNKYEPYKPDRRIGATECRLIPDINKAIKFIDRFPAKRINPIPIWIDKNNYEMFSNYLDIKCKKTDLYIFNHLLVSLAMCVKLNNKYMLINSKRKSIPLPYITYGKKIEAYIKQLSELGYIVVHTGNGVNDTILEITQSLIDKFNIPAIMNCTPNERVRVYTIDNILVCSKKSLKYPFIILEEYLKQK